MSAACPTFPRASEPSWWQLDAAAPERGRLTDDLETELCVVGAGVTGCSAARALAQAGARVTLVDARSVAGGASGRNGGFLLAGTQLRFPRLVAAVGTDRGRALYGRSIAARDALMATAQELGLVPQHVTRSDSLRLATTPQELAELRLEAALLAEHGFSSTYVEAVDLPEPLSHHFAGGLRVGGDGSMHPAHWIHALADDAAAAGVQIVEHAPVTRLTPERDGGAVVLDTEADGYRIRAGAVLLCTEAWLPGLVPQLTGHVIPYRSQVLAATAAGDPDLLAMPTWSRDGWDYAQQRPDGVLVAGGEQIEDADLYATWDETVDRADQAGIERWLRNVLSIDPVIEGRWAGVLSRSSDGFPYVGPLTGSAGVYVAGGWGGAGNVLGFDGGHLLAELLTAADRIPPEWRARRIA